jgi:hypothetical protein
MCRPESSSSFSLSRGTMSRSKNRSAISPADFLYVVKKRKKKLREVMRLDDESQSLRS